MSKQEMRINGEDVIVEFKQDSVDFTCKNDCRYPAGHCRDWSYDEWNSWNGKCAYNSNR